MYLFFDTETTGLADYAKPITDECQPKIISLAMIVTDAAGKELNVYKTLIKHPGFVIDEKGEAFGINKISNAAVDKYGVGLEGALMMFKQESARAEMKIAHNYRFDGFLLKGAYEKLGIDSGPIIDKYCTMLGIKPITGAGSLAAAYQHCTGKPIHDAHDSLSDTRACKDVFFWIKNSGHYKPQERKVPAAKKAVAA